MDTAKAVCGLLAAVLFASVAHAADAVRSKPRCIVPARPGGGMDFTCKLARTALQAGHAGVTAEPPLQISYIPGGIGAVAWNSMISQRLNDPDTLVAFSSGSLLNLAQGKFGKSSASDVRWVAAFAADYGMIAVRADSPFKSLKDLMAALKRDPSGIAIGASGTVGSQDWIKMARMAKLADVDPKSLRFVALEGGGDAFTALSANLVQVASGDASEATTHALGREFRILAVLSEARLPGPLAAVPTAREQGFDLTWPIVRGFYMGPKVSDADYARWVARFDKMIDSAEFKKLRTENGLYPFAMTGAALTEYVKKTVDNYGEQAKDLGFVRHHQ